MKSLGEGWDDALSQWAHARPDIRALVQIGSRVQAGAAVDRWSDYDYQLVTSRPERYRDGSFAAELGPCWAHGSHTAFGNAVKVTAVYEGALEADFVVLSSLDLRIAALALRWPGTRGLWPRALRSGIDDLRIVAGPGWRMIKGGAPWEGRYARISPLRPAMTEAEFREVCGEFWTQLVWAAKKLGRGEFRACQRGIHAHLVECLLRLHQEQALLEGRAAYPLARRAEGWMGPAQLRATDFATGPDRVSLGVALARSAEAFTAGSAELARLKGWSAGDYSEVRGWLSGLLGA